MTAVGRLWRRAPLWRLALAATLVFGALTALYPAPPPRLPSWIHRPAWLHLPPWLPSPPAPQAATASPAASPSRDASGVVATPIDPPLHGTLTVGGRTVPLPAGDWHELVAGRNEQAAEITATVLGRWQGARLTGFLKVLATTGPADGGGEAGVDAECNSNSNYERATWSDTGRTCWFVRKTDIPPPSEAAAGPARDIDDAAMRRIRDLGVAVPAWLSAAVWSHADGSEMMVYELLVANGRNPNDQSAALGAVKAWMSRFAPFLHRGFDGKLDPNSIRAAARDPGAAEDGTTAAHAHG